MVNASPVLLQALILILAVVAVVSCVVISQLKMKMARREKENVSTILRLKDQLNRSKLNEAIATSDVSQLIFDISKAKATIAALENSSRGMGLGSVKASPWETIK